LAPRHHIQIFGIHNKSSLLNNNSWIKFGKFCPTGKCVWSTAASSKVMSGATAVRIVSTKAASSALT
jgi:hypothetical protein